MIMLEHVFSLKCHRESSSLIERSLFILFDASSFYCLVEYASFNRR